MYTHTCLMVMFSTNLSLLCCYLGRHFITLIKSNDLIIHLSVAIIWNFSIWFLVGKKLNTNERQALPNHFRILSLMFQSLDQFSVQGHLGGSVVECLPSAQVMILGSWDPGIKSHIRFPMGSLLLPLPMSLLPSLCLSWINKILKKRYI